MFIWMVNKTPPKIAKLTPMVRLQTAPTVPGTTTVVVSKIDAHNL